MNRPDYLVLGATGAIGSAVVEALLKHGNKVSVLVRNRRKIERLFGDTDKIEVIEGDALKPEDVNMAASEKKYITHAINFPYDKWENNMEKVTQNVIEAAALNKSTILFPGNIYNFGMLTPILEDSPALPVSRKGHIRVKLESMLKTAAEASQCRVVNLRLPDFYGPNVVNGLMMPVFANALKGKPMQWLVSAKVPHQLVYIRDAGELFVRLAQMKDFSDYEVFNFGGITVNSIKEWFEQIARAVRVKPKMRILPKWMISILSPFSPVVREVREMAYLFENPILLNDSKLKKQLPDFQPTDMDVSIRETLDWFKKNVI